MTSMDSLQGVVHHAAVPEAGVAALVGRVRRVTGVLLGRLRLGRMLMWKPRLEERGPAQHGHGPRQQPASCQCPHDRKCGMPKLLLQPA